MMSETLEVRKGGHMPPHAVRLDGCEPTPLASYLKALGVLRTVASQLDSGARGWWQDDVFHLESSGGADGIKRLLLERYEPTPVLGPWNGGSGFYPKDRMGQKILATIREGGAARFEHLRRIIDDVAQTIEEMGLTERPADATKSDFVTELRNRADERFLDWIDAAVSLGSDELLYPPLLGTGGNDGRLDFTVNFLANVMSLIDPDDGSPLDGAADLLDAALFAHPTSRLAGSAIGQFAPGSAGGPNAQTGFTGGALINPWDFVLMIEGAILFAAGTVRRLESRGRAVLAYPFTVRPTGAGSGAAALGDEAPARAETWVPLWGRPSTLPEVERVLAEGRIVVNGRMPRDGLDAARAVAKLGIDRGIDSLQRYAYMQRSGRAYLAAPLGRIRVRRNPKADLLDDLDRSDWLSRFQQIARDGHAPARLGTLLHRLEDAVFALAEGVDGSLAVQRCLVILGECQRYLAVSPNARERCPPVPPLRREWAEAADDGSSPFALAVGLAGLHAERPRVAGGTRSHGVALTMAEYMAPLAVGPFERYRRWADGDSHHRVVWGAGSIHRNLARVMRRRLLDQAALGLSDVPLRFRCSVPRSAVMRWLSTASWDRRLDALIQGLALVRRPWIRRKREDPELVATPVAFALLKPFFTPRSQLLEALGTEARHTVDESALHPEVSLPPPKEIVRLLGGGDVDKATDRAHATLRSRGLSVPRFRPEGRGIDGPRLLSALMVPLGNRDLRSLLHSYLGPEFEPSEIVPLNQEG